MYSLKRKTAKSFFFCVFHFGLVSVIVVELISMNPTDENQNFLKKFAEEKKQRKEELLRLKQRALEDGKEDFDFDRLTKEIDAESEFGGPTPKEQLYSIWEEKYYVQYRDARTMDDFIEIMKEVQKY